MNKDKSKLAPNNLTCSEDGRTDQNIHPGEIPRSLSELHHTHLEFIFKRLEDDVIAFIKNELENIKRSLSPDYTKCFGNWMKNVEIQEDFSKIYCCFANKINHDELTGHLKNTCQHQIKFKLKMKHQTVFEGIALPGNASILNQIYTRLRVAEGEIKPEKSQRKFRQRGKVPKKFNTPERTIREEDVFKAATQRLPPIRTVLTKGVAGIGKTILTQKFILDWAEEKNNQNIQFLFPFTFRELNVLKDKKLSLAQLLHHFFPEMKKLQPCVFEGCLVLFIFDGLDEFRLPLNFHNSKALTDITKSTSLDLLLINLINGNLLPSAHIWITTRPAAAGKIPSKHIGMTTEVRGFADPQKEEYFRKKLPDEQQANMIISHIKTSRSLHIMCHIPVFCWITATVLEEVLNTSEEGVLPKTLTEMYIHFLMVQTKRKIIKYDGGTVTDPPWSSENIKLIKSLGKLAYEQLQKGNLIFYESELIESGIDVTAASMHSGVFTQVVKNNDLNQDKVYSFIHQTVQEFFAALHVHVTFMESGVNLLKKQHVKSKWSELFEILNQKADSRENPLKNSLEEQKETLQITNELMTLFHCFIWGLSLQTNQSVLQGLT